MLELAILGLLKEKPMHGYELKRRLSYTLGHFWTVSYGSLYPALKRLEKSGSIERAYSVKEKTRTRNVYRITREGEKLFMKLLSESANEAAASNSEKFDIRMAFFQYLEPEVRLNLLEERRRHLEEEIGHLKKFRSGKTEDHYRKGLMRHKVEQVRSDIRWIEKLMVHERETIMNGEGKGHGEQETQADEPEVRAASSPS
ncbi:MAG: PadR family transcriptional regulator [Actinomycetota bacterium]|nr:PadR family transcriptional regulator [Actinomycetota bacterium]